jgi:hypothetical protein
LVSSTKVCPLIFGLLVTIPIICTCHINSRMVVFKHWIDLAFSLQVSNTYVIVQVILGSLDSICPTCVNNVVVLLTCIKENKISLFIICWIFLKTEKYLDVSK